MMRCQRTKRINAFVTPLLVLVLIHGQFSQAFSPKIVTTTSTTSLSLNPDCTLIEEGEPSSSGKSRIVEGELSCGREVIVKLSKNRDALQRESENYDKIAKDKNTAGLFAKLYDHVTDIERYPTKSALVMEKGCQDLRQYIQENGALEGQKLRNAAGIATLCVEAVHSAKMVWTEIKAPNFIVQEDANVLKGIDLESAIPEAANPIDFTPQACPPEFALTYLCGQEATERMMQNFDIWSLGMVLYEMSNGEEYFGTEDELIIANELRAMDGVNWKKEDVDPAMKDLVEMCLTKDPEERPTIEEVLEHPYLRP
jgi:serine/threonine protein kinase